MWLVLTVVDTHTDSRESIWLSMADLEIGDDHGWKMELQELSGQDDPVVRPRGQADLEALVLAGLNRDLDFLVSLWRASDERMCRLGGVDRPRWELYDDLDYMTLDGCVGVWDADSVFGTILNVPAEKKWCIINWRILVAPEPGDYAFEMHLYGLDVGFHLHDDAFPQEEWPLVLSLLTWE